MIANTRHIQSYKPLGLSLNSNPIIVNRGCMRKYEDLDILCSSIMVTYVWIDGSGVSMRSKDKTFEYLPKSPKDLPIWFCDGSSTQQATNENSEIYLFPQRLYHDPFRRGSHLLVLCDCYLYNYTTSGTNFRKDCSISCDKAELYDPWFGFCQEFLLVTAEGLPLGWPDGGFPAPPGPYYCGLGANRIVARDLIEAFVRCSLYAGVKLNGTFGGASPSQWCFKVGPSQGLKAADDLWMARYILMRLSEDYGTVASFEPQPVPDWPGNGCLSYFSTKEMRSDDGMAAIQTTVDKLSRRHGAHMNEYDANSGSDNARRLDGRNFMPNIKEFTAGIANRTCCIRIPRQVTEDKRGYIEDRRPASNADPYRITTVMLRTCIFDD